MELSIYSINNSLENIIHPKEADRRAEQSERYIADVSAASAPRTAPWIY